MVYLDPYKKLRLYSVFLLILALSVTGKAQNNHDVDITRSYFDEALTKRQSYRWLKDLCYLGPRLSGSKNSVDAIEWVRDVMDTCGFDRVTLQPVMVPHWSRGLPESAVLWDTKGGKHDLEVLAIGGSVKTPDGGLRSEVVEVGSLLELERLSRKDVEGKIVFYNALFDQTNISTGASYGANVPTRSQGAIKAAEKGAVASVIRSVSSSYDDVPHTGVGQYREGLDSIPAAALGVASADRLHDLLTLDPRAQLELEIHSKWHPDAQSYNVIAEITGSEHPDEIIVVGGHLDSWDVGHGAHDDGAGCMHALGALKLIQDSGIRPKRTIRAVMFINEENGTRGGIKYAEEAISSEENHIVAIESDAGGFTPRGFGFTGSEAQLEKMRGWLGVFPKNTISYMSKGGGGVDIGPLHRADNTPMIGLSVDGQKMFDLHHSANDVFETVHPRELELGTASIATIIYLISQYGL